MTGMTHVMVKGMNIPLDAPGVRAVLRWTPGPGAPDVDASVLLLGRDGRVRSDADFVFYNEPRHPSGLARHLPKKRVPGGLTDTVEVDLAALDPTVDRVVIAASCDGGPFRLVQDLTLTVFDTAAPPQAAPLLTFEVAPDTGHETALNCGELYRKDAGWKFRALGQGYASGLVGLATEFGIAVDDGEVDSGRAASAPATAAPEPPPTSAYGYPLQAPSAAHVPAQPAYGYPQPVAATQAAEPALTAPTAPAPVHQQPQHGYPAYGYPQPVAAAPVPAGAPAEQGYALPPQGPQFQPGR
ncbi:TerD family protein [Streptomyces sp. V4-01]|uniref:TerD family protein n=1 Tax=Actinacidiphila polyblastidii TaxID=3110430 RepID=A0ABU7PD84_9ACTN|nr:TerD family protein [Streptomyces sp. V4-01]